MEYMRKKTMQILHMLTRGVGEGREVKRGKNKRKRRENSRLLSQYNGTHVMLQNLRFLKWKLCWDFEPNSNGFEWRLSWSFNYENWKISLEWWDMRIEIYTTQTGPWKQGFQTRTVHWTVKGRGSRVLRLDRGRTEVEPWWRHN